MLLPATTFPPANFDLASNKIPILLRTLCVTGHYQAAVGGNKGHGHGKHSVNISAPTASGTVAADARAKSGLARYDSPFSLFFVHMVALLKKRYLTFRRDKKIFAFVVLMPALFVFAGIMIVRIDNQSDQPSLRLTPEASCVCACIPVCFFSHFLLSWCSSVRRRHSAAPTRLHDGVQFFEPDTDSETLDHLPVFPLHPLDRADIDSVGFCLVLFRSNTTRGGRLSHTPSSAPTRSQGVPVIRPS